MIEGRIFLVGYPRSGTTLLQSLLVTQPAVASFPESHFFDRPLDQVRYRRVIHWGLVTFSARRRFRHQLQRVGRQLASGEDAVSIPRYSFWLKDYSRAFVQLLDTFTTRQGKTFWLEKTPGHLRHIDLIERLIPDAKFIHMVRNGVDAISSYYAVASQYPTAWYGTRTLERCIAEWQRAVQITNRHLAKPNHWLVRYEALVTDPPAVLQQTCAFIGTPFHPELLQHYAQHAAALILPHEQWKADVQQPIVNKNGTRFYQLFTEEQRAAIHEGLAALEPRCEPR